MSHSNDDVEGWERALEMQMRHAQANPGGGASARLMDGSQVNPYRFQDSHPGKLAAPGADLDLVLEDVVAKSPITPHGEIAEAERLISISAAVDKARDGQQRPSSRSTGVEQGAMRSPETAVSRHKAPATRTSSPVASAPAHARVSTPARSAAARAPEPVAAAAALSGQPVLRASRAPAGASLKAQLQQARAWWQARAPSERRTIGLSAWALSLWLVYNALDPGITAVRSAMQTSHKAAATAKEEQQALTEARRSAQARRTEKLQALQRLQASRAGAQQAVTTAGGGLMQPEQVLALMHELVAQRKSLKLLELRTLASTPVLSPAEAQPAAAAASAPLRTAAAVAQAASAAAPQATPQGSPASAARLYEHPLEIAVQGTYASLLEFTQSLQAIDKPVVWDAVHLQVAGHPMSTLTLRLHVVSRSPQWLPKL